MPRTLITACLTAAVLMTAGCSQPSAGRGQAGGGAQAFPVKVIVVQEQMVPESTDYLATLRSRNSSALQPQVEGEITRIFVHSGDRVAAGAPILEIDPLKQQAAVNNQEATRNSKLATLELNRVELERRKKLYAAGVISKSDLDTAEAAFNASKADAEALEAGLSEQRVQLRYYTVKAPTPGIIGDIPVHVGDRVTTQTMLTTLDRGGELEAYINVPAEKSRDLRAGPSVDILDGEGKAVQRSRVTFISPQVDSSTQTLLLKATVANADGRFRNDQSVHARVIWRERKAALIPVTAVSRLSGKMFAFVAETQGQQTFARQRVIQVGDLNGNDYVVLDGIKPGDRLIISGIQLLVDGMPIIPQS
ncbi:MAG: efflux RND transporter periplasmic adaptor subunit [Acidobacteriia bacterium]|nr:efflux RND transporter periplasmic adaptor subunit [Terriglobia bacterium]